MLMAYLTFHMTAVNRARREHEAWALLLVWASMGGTTAVDGVPGDTGRKGGA